MARRQLNIAEAMKLVLQDSQDFVESDSESESDCHPSPSYNDNDTVAETESSTTESVDNNGACNGEIISPTVLELEDANACKHAVTVEDMMMVVPDSDLLTIADNGGAGICLQEFDSPPTTTVAVEEVAEMMVSSMPDQLNNGPTNDQLMASENGDDDVSISVSMDDSTASQVASDTSTVDFSEDHERPAVNKRKATPALWIRSIQKSARLGGKQYVNTKNETVLNAKLELHAIQRCVKNQPLGIANHFRLRKEMRCFSTFGL